MLSQSFPEQCKLLSNAGCFSWPPLPLINFCRAARLSSLLFGALLIYFPRGASPWHNLISGLLAGFSLALIYVLLSCAACLRRTDVSLLPFHISFKDLQMLGRTVPKSCRIKRQFQGGWGLRLDVGMQGDLDLLGLQRRKSEVQVFSFLRFLNFLFFF